MLLLVVRKLEKMDDFLTAKRRLTKNYQRLFEQIDGVDLFIEPAFGTSNYWLQTVIIDSDIHNRDIVLEVLNNEGVMARPIWTPMNELDPYRNCPKGDLSVTNELNEQVINIPSTPIKENSFHD